MKWKYQKEVYTTVAMLFCDKSIKKCTKEKGQHLYHTVLENWTCIFKRMKLDQYILSYININSRQIDLNLKPETLKIVEEKVGHTLQAIDIIKEFLNRTLGTQDQLLTNGLKLN